MLSSPCSSPFQPLIQPIIPTLHHIQVLSLIEENTAAALHYGIDRVFEEPNTVVYYNMGASAVQVSVATYSSYQVKNPYPKPD